jgi:hypothetical protein
MMYSHAKGHELMTSNTLAPITEEVDISYDRWQFNGSFYKENIYRQDAAPEVDAAWEALGTNCM